MSAIGDKVTLAWVERATGKTARGSFRLTHVYRDRGRLVATDGHRMHLAPETDGTGETGFLDGAEDWSFPGYQSVSPIDTETIASFRVSKSDVASLKRLASISESESWLGATFKIYPPSGVMRVDMGPDGDMDLSATFAIKLTGDSVSTKFRLDLRYFVDAIEPFATKTGVEVTLKTGMRGKTKGVPPFVFEVRGHTAIIMPMRLDD